jgi:hypothetical protein
MMFNKILAPKQSRNLTVARLKQIKACDFRAANELGPRFVRQSDTKGVTC